MQPILTYDTFSNRLVNFGNAYCWWMSGDVLLWTATPLLLFFVRCSRAGHCQERLIKLIVISFWLLWKFGELTKSNIKDPFLDWWWYIANKECTGCVRRSNMQSFNKCQHLPWSDTWLAYGLNFSLGFPKPETFMRFSSCWKWLVSNSMTCVRVSALGVLRSCDRAASHCSCSSSIWICPTDGRFQSGFITSSSPPPCLVFWVSIGWIPNLSNNNFST